MKQLKPMKLNLTVGMNRTIINGLSKGRGATLKATKKLYVPSETFTGRLKDGQEIEVEVPGHYREVEVDFHFVRDKSRGGSRKGKGKT